MVIWIYMCYRIMSAYFWLHAILLLTPLMLDGQISFHNNNAIFTLRWLLLICKRRTIKTALYSQNHVVSVNRSLCIKSTFFKYHSLCCLIAGEINLHSSLSLIDVCVHTLFTNVISHGGKSDICTHIISHWLQYRLMIFRWKMRAIC